MLKSMCNEKMKISEIPAFINNYHPDMAKTY